MFLNLLTTFSKRLIQMLHKTLKTKDNINIFALLQQTSTLSTQPMVLIVYKQQIQLETKILHAREFDFLQLMKSVLLQLT